MFKDRFNSLSHIQRTVYHLPKNNYSYRPFVFELLKTVMTVIFPGGDFSEFI